MTQNNNKARLLLGSPQSHDENSITGLVLITFIPISECSDEHTHWLSQTTAFTACICKVELSVSFINSNPLYILKDKILKHIIEPRHEISNNVVFATSKGLDQPVHTHSMIRALAFRLNML